MNSKALKILEFDKITGMLSDRATSAPGRILCSCLVPSANADEIRTAQQETTDACTRIRLNGQVNFGNTRDITASLKRLDIGGSLSTSELFYIGELLNNVTRVRSYGVREGTDSLPDSLDGFFSSLDALPPVSRELFRCILSEDTVSDDASPALNKIRRQMKTNEDRMHSEINNILNEHRSLLMEPVIAMRDGSYCLPVKAEYKAKVPGVIHDQSATGSTVFIEPMAVIRMNNERRELEIAEKREIDEILAELSRRVAPECEIIRSDCGTMAHLDFVFAKAKLSADMSGSEPKFNTEGFIDIREGRHPLLNKSTVVPITVSLGKDYDLLIVTGPNTGGKTVSLKTIGLFTLMGQAGLHIPAFDGSSLAVFNEVFADIGDEQSIEQSLSTFSGHMKNIVEILSKADETSLCLFDELGAGTDPTEGAALAISVLSFLHSMKTRTVATTHYSELKVYALSTPGVENACCEFDVETLKPTYRILIGIPGKSNAFAISKKLGLPDHIIDDAKTHIRKNDVAFEDLLTKLENDRTVMEKERMEIDSYRREIEELKSRYEKADSHIEERKEKIIREAREEAQRILSKAKETADSSIRSINRLTSDAGLSRALEKERGNLREGLKAVETPSGIHAAKPSAASGKPPKLKLGDSVKILSMNHTAIVSSLPNEKGNLFVRMGILRTQVNIGDVELIDDGEVPSGGGKSSSYAGGGSFAKAAEISPEINLIGLNVDDACAALDKYLDDCILSHLSVVRIIHGRGTGALKKGIHEYLRKQSFIKSYKQAEFDDGGEAVTVVTFK